MELHLCLLFHFHTHHVSPAIVVSTEQGVKNQKRRCRLPRALISSPSRSPTVRSLDTRMIRMRGDFLLSFLPPFLLIFFLPEAEPCRFSSPLRETPWRRMLPVWKKKILWFILHIHQQPVTGSKIHVQNSYHSYKT